MTVEHLPGAKINPLALLAKAMEAEPTKVIIISCSPSNEWSVAWSAMQMQELVYGSAIGDLMVKQALTSIIKS